MKKLVLLVFIVGNLSFGAYTAKVDSASNNIPTSFSSAAGSLFASSIPAGSMIQVQNYTSAILMVSCGDYASAPSSTLATNRNQVPVPAGGSTPGVNTIDNFTLSNNGSCYVRSDGSAASSGVVYLTIK